ILVARPAAGDGYLTHRWARAALDSGHRALCDLDYGAAPLRPRRGAYLVGFLQTPLGLVARAYRLLRHPVRGLGPKGSAVLAWTDAVCVTDRLTASVRGPVNFEESACRRARRRIQQSVPCAKCSSPTVA